MSADRIRDAALARFATQGYDATSLSEIAGDVGIKTPSIYAHFASKQALFLELVEASSSKEVAIVRKNLLQHVPVAEAMHDYLFSAIDRFAVEPHLHFWLRSIYLPPLKIHREISVYDRKFAASLEEIVATALKDPAFGVKTPTLSYEILSTAFLGMLRSLHAELLYCGSSDSTKILTAMWIIFERALRDTKA